MQVLQDYMNWLVKSVKAQVVHNVPTRLKNIQQGSKTLHTAREMIQFQVILLYLKHVAICMILICRPLRFIGSR